MKINLRMLRFLFFMAMVASFTACEQAAEQTSEVTEASNIFHDSTILKIHRLQDERRAEDIASFLTSENREYRRAAAMALASVQEPAMIPYLAVLLDDSSMNVRSAAAYALGQTYDSAALPHLAEALPQEDSVLVIRELLESTGKVITQETLAILHQFVPENDAEKEGFAWALYRAGIRNVHDPELISRAMDLLDSGNTYLTRLGAAHFLARTPNTDLGRFAGRLARFVTTEPAPAVRMALAQVLGRTGSRRGREVLSGTLLSDSDYRVRVNAIRALSNFNEQMLTDTTWLFESIDDPQINVRIAAAGILATMDGLDPVFLVEKALRSENKRVGGLLFKAAVRNGQDYPDAVEVIKEEYESADDPYYKAWLLEALGNSPVAYDYIVTQIFSEVPPVVSTAGMTALTEMRGKEGFPETLKQPMADVMRDVMKTGDIGLIYMGGGLLSDDRFDFREHYEDISFLYEAKDKLSLPQDNEALQILNTTIAFFEGAEEIPVTENPYNHPVDWELVKRIPRDLEVTLHTAKGPVTLRLYIENSPGSVANFVQLAMNDYYDGIAFHRVVPNFVVQGGCPRGDGFGGENYSIRSEFSDLRYEEGSVGMASAGKDTEGTQWFITHSPTPHLDGRYTIFAQVTAGMDVVHQLEVGDQIEDIVIPEF